MPTLPQYSITTVQHNQGLSLKATLAQNNGQDIDVATQLVLRAINTATNVVSRVVVPYAAGSVNVTAATQELNLDFERLAGTNRFDLNRGAATVSPAVAASVGAMGSATAASFSSLPNGTYNMQVSMTIHNTAVAVAGGALGASIEDGNCGFTFADQPTAPGAAALATEENALTVTLFDGNGNSTVPAGARLVSLSVNETATGKSESATIQKNTVSNVWEYGSSSLRGAVDVIITQNAGLPTSIKMDKLTEGGAGNLSAFATVDVDVDYMVAYDDTVDSNGLATSSDDTYLVPQTPPALRGMLVDVADAPVILQSKNITDSEDGASVSGVSTYVDAAGITGGWHKKAALIMYAAGGATTQIATTKLSTQIAADFSGEPNSTMNALSGYVRLGALPVDNTDTLGNLGAGVSRKVLSTSGNAESFGTSAASPQVMAMTNALLRQRKGGNVGGIVHIALLVATEQGATVTNNANAGDMYAIKHAHAYNNAGAANQSIGSVSYTQMGLWSSDGVVAAFEAMSLIATVASSNNNFAVDMALSSEKAFTDLLDANNLEKGSNLGGRTGTYVISADTAFVEGGAGGHDREGVATYPGPTGAVLTAGTGADLATYGPGLLVDSNLAIPNDIHTFVTIPNFTVTITVRPKSWNGNTQSATVLPGNQNQGEGLLVYAVQYNAAQTVYGQVPDFVPVASGVLADKGYILYRLRAVGETTYAAKSELYTPQLHLANGQLNPELELLFTNVQGDAGGQVLLDANQPYDCLGVGAGDGTAESMLTAAAAGGALYKWLNVVPYTFKQYLLGYTDGLAHGLGCYTVTKVTGLIDDQLTSFGMRLRLNGTGVGSSNALNAHQNATAGNAADYSVGEKQIGKLKNVTVGLSAATDGAALMGGQVKATYQAEGYAAGDGVKLRAVMDGGNGANGVGAAAGGVDMNIFWANGAGVAAGTQPGDYQLGAWGAAGNWGASQLSDVQESGLLQSPNNAGLDMYLQARKLKYINGAISGVPTDALVNGVAGVAGLQSYYETYASDGFLVSNPTRQSWTTGPGVGGNNLVSAVDAGEFLVADNTMEVTMNAMVESEWADAGTERIFIGVYAVGHALGDAASQAALEARDVEYAGNVFDGEELAEAMATACGDGLNANNNPTHFKDNLVSAYSNAGVKVTLNCPAQARRDYKVIAFRYIKDADFNLAGNSLYAGGANSRINFYAPSATPAVIPSLGNQRLTDVLDAVLETPSTTHTIGAIMDTMDSGPDYASIDQLTNVAGTAIPAGGLAADSNFTISWTMNGAAVKNIIVIVDLENYSSATGGNPQEGSTAVVTGLMTTFRFDTVGNTYVVDTQAAGQGAVSSITVVGAGDASARTGAGSITLKVPNYKLNGYAAVVVSEFGETAVIMRN